MSPTPSGLFGPVNRHFAPTTKVLNELSPYNRLTNGASGKYVGVVVNVNGTVIGKVSAVAGSVVVAKTTPGRILPAGEPMPGKLSAVPKVPAEPPTNGNWTKG